MIKKLLFLLLILSISTYAFKSGDVIQAILSCEDNGGNIDTGCTVNCFIRYDNGTEGYDADTCDQTTLGRWVLNYTVPYNINDGVINMCLNGTNSNSSTFVRCAFADVQRGSGWTFAAMLGILIPATILLLLAYLFKDNFIVWGGLGNIGVMLILLSVRQAQLLSESFDGPSAISTLLDTVYLIVMWILIATILIYVLMVVWMLISRFIEVMKRYA